MSEAREAGTIHGSYKLVELIGLGGMGQVYLAVHTKLGRQVALKFLRSKYTHDPAAVRRFFSEAQVVNQIRHPNIVEITDLIESEGTFYYVMEFLVGETLGHRLAERGALPLADTLSIAVQVCDALAAVHGAGVIHRDLKPDNIFLVRDERPGPERVKLLDFGLVKLAAPTPSEQEQEQEQEQERELELEHSSDYRDYVAGTPEYMSPEQIRAVGEVDRQSDIYSFGAILYEMAAGARPLTAQGFGELLVKVINEQPEPPTSRRPEAQIPARFEKLILRCLEKEPQRRPEATELLAELRELAAQHRVPAAGAEPAGQRRRRLPLLLVLLAGVAVLGLVIAGSLIYRRARTASTSSHPARQGKPIARLTQLWGDVLYRAEGSTQWRPAERNLQLYYHDSLRTARGARSRVVFDVGGRLDVDERTLVLIEPPAPGAGPAPVARVQEGTVRGEATPGVPLRFVSPDGKTTQIAAVGREPVAFRLRASKDGTELAVLKGSADVRSAQRQVQLAANQLVELDRAGQPGAPQTLIAFPSLITPGVDVRLEEGRVMLRWSPVTGAARFRVQMSHFTSFDENVVDTVTAAPVGELRIASLKPDNYVWRVASIDGRGHEGEFGFARRFTVHAGRRSDAGPARAGGSAMLVPADNGVVQYIREARPVEFRWRDSGRSLLVVARSRDLKRNIVVRRSVRGARTTVEGLKPGVHYWGVFSFGKNKELQPRFEQAFRVVIVVRQNPEIHLPPIDWK